MFGMKKMKQQLRELELFNQRHSGFYNNTENELRLLREEDGKWNDKLSHLINMQRTQHTQWLEQVRKIEAICKYLGIEIEHEIVRENKFTIKKKRR